MRVEQLAEGVTLYLADCREVLPMLPTPDLLVADPPYGIGYDHRELGGIIGDDAPFDPESFLVAKAHIFWGANHFASRLPDATRWLVWLKHDPGLFGKRHHAPFDLAWTDIGGSGRAFKHIWDGSIREGERYGKPNCHPHQKPTELMEWCLEFVPDAHSVCDPFMGSGTTGVAAVRGGRNFAGVEIEERWFDIACQRIDAALATPRLSLDRPPPPKQHGLFETVQ